MINMSISTDDDDDDDETESPPPYQMDTQQN